MGHIAAIRVAAEERGGIGEVLLTHSHGDHSDGVERLGIEPTTIAEGDSLHGMTAIATPGHADDHVCFLLEDACFAGDLILGEGSTIVPPRAQGGSLADYMRSLEKLATLEIRVIYPGHGPPIDDPAAKIAEYIEHRSERERRLIEAMARGERSRQALLAAVWDDVPRELLPMAAFAMQAHEEKLAEEGELPADLAE